MDLLVQLFGKKKEEARKTIADYQREALVKEGGKQFQLLIERGLRIPVAHL